MPGLPSLTGAERQVGDVTILDLSGRITLGEGAVVLVELVEKLHQQKKFKIILNMQNVVYVDSSGIQELVRVFTQTRNSGGELKLLKLTKKVHDLLHILNIYTVFDIKDDEQEAVNSFVKN